MKINLIFLLNQYIYQYFISASRKKLKILMGSSSQQLPKILLQKMQIYWLVIEMYF